MSTVNPKFPNTGAISDQLAADNARVANYVDGILGRVDQLVEAVSEGRWHDVRRISDYIARSSATYQCPAIAVDARDVCIATIETDNAEEIKRRIVKLIGTCGRESAKLNG